MWQPLEEDGGSGGGSSGAFLCYRKRRRRKKPPMKMMEPFHLILSVLAASSWLLLLASLPTASSFTANSMRDAAHITANAGDSIVFNCGVQFPGQDSQPVPYVVEWSRKDRELPIYIWYDNYPTHADKDYAGRVTKIDAFSSAGANFGLASLNITNVTEADRGWYNCKVLFLDRGPPTAPKGTWYHLDVHAPPYFVNQPEDVVYVHTGESVILACEVGGTPPPELVWSYMELPIKISNRIGVFNGGMELRISKVLDRDLGDYTCIARNGVSGGRIHHTTKVVMAGGAVITEKPQNVTAEEGQALEMPCKGHANPGNISVMWFRHVVDGSNGGGGSHEQRITSTPRLKVKSDGTLYFEKVISGDEGRYTCKVTNGFGRPIEASAHVAVEYAARVSFTPTTQIIPRGLPGVVHCHIEANPEIQFVTWTKDNRLYDPFEIPGLMAMENGSILIDMVGDEHAGDYTCKPVNIHGSSGPSSPMRVVIKDPPMLIKRPDQEYHKATGDKVTMPCEAKGTPYPKKTWRRVDGRHLPRKRHRIYNGELTLENLRKSDHGIYECVVSNEVATVAARTKIFIVRTTPHPPTNVTVTKAEAFSVTLSWMPGYSGCGSCEQTYKIRYREKDSKFPNWIEMSVNPPDSRKIVIHNLVANTKYVFQVIGTNEYGDGMYSEIIEAKTKADGGLEWSVYPPTASPFEQVSPTAKRKKKCLQSASHQNRTARSATLRKLLASGIPDCIEFNLDIKSIPGDETGTPHVPPGQAPGPATNLTLEPEAGGWVLRWIGPKDDQGNDDPNLRYYTVQVKKDTQDEEWEPLTDLKIDVDEASYLIKNMGTASAYLFRVFSHSVTSYAISEEKKYTLPENVKRRAVTAGLIGGILFFIVSIVLSVCTVKICNKKRRRKQERAINEINKIGSTPNMGRAEFQL